MNFGSAPVGRTCDFHRRCFDQPQFGRHRLHEAILHVTTPKLEMVHLAATPDRQPQPFGQCIDARHADAVQPARHLVAVLVELAAGVQLGQRDLGGRALRLVLVVEFDAGWNAAAVVDDRDRVVGVDRDDDVVAMPGKRLVDRVVDHLEHHVVQPGAVVRIADVHARTLAHRLQSLEDLDAADAIVRAPVGLRLVHGG